MNKKRSPEFDKRDLLFAHSCEVCGRAGHCSFKTSPEGPEEVCWQLIIDGTYNCESCVRYMIGGGCHFECVFFRPIVAVEGSAHPVTPFKPPALRKELCHLVHRPAHIEDRQRCCSDYVSGV